MDFLTLIAFIFILFEIISFIALKKKSDSQSTFFEEESSEPRISMPSKPDAVVFINVEEHNGHYYAWLIDNEQRENFITQAPSFDELKEKVTDALTHDTLTLKLVFRQT